MEQIPDKKLVDVEPDISVVVKTEVTLGEIATGTLADVLGIEKAERFYSARQANQERSTRYALRRFGQTRFPR